MARQYWFASPLTDARGAWSGRFLRPLDMGNGIDAALMREWAASQPAGIGQLFVPADDAQSGWTPDQLAAAGLCVLATVGPCIIGLDTARDPAWSFAASGANLADTGWLLRRRPTQVSGTYRSPLPLIRLLAEIEHDAETRQLEAFFRADVELSYQLLRLLNSAAYAPRTPVRNLGHAITLIGRRQLQRWLELLVYAKFGADARGPNPLLQLAAYRGLLLEELARHAGRSQDEMDTAYMTGIFSLLDRLIALPLAKIVTQLPLLPEVIAALARGEGLLGRWLALAVASEHGEFATAAGLLESLGVSSLSWLQIQDAAYRWAFELGVSAEISR